jgi:hypothetical protein
MNVDNLALVIDDLKLTGVGSQEDISASYIFYFTNNRT